MRLRRLVTETGAVMLGIVLLIWTLIPVYTMLLIALDPEEGEVEFSTSGPRHRRSRASAWF